MTSYYSYQSDQSILSTTKKFYYNDDFLVSRVSSRDSKNQRKINRITYPKDYSDVTGFNLNTLVSKHIIDIPIKQETSVEGKITGGNIIKYDEYGQPVALFKYQGTANSDTLTLNNSIVIENEYELVQEVYYSGFKPFQIDNKGSFFSSIIWDSQDHLIANIQNAQSNSVAYTSFESNSGGYWSGIDFGSVVVNESALTGLRYLQKSSFAISKAGLSPSQTYIVSYWSRNGSYMVTGTHEGWPITIGTSVRAGEAWTCYEHKVSGINSVTISGSGIIDELRLVPNNGMMTTYSYGNFEELLSICDPANKLAQYEYDPFGRLSIIRDQHNNILKRICYSFKGQAINCGVDTLAYWQPIFTECEKVGGLPTGNLLVTEKNMNESSATYGQTRVVTLEEEGICSIECEGEGKKIINGICETGTKVCTGTYRPPGETTWYHYFHYVWSDSSTSITYTGLGKFCLEL